MAGNGWRRNVASGVNGADIAGVLQQKMQTHPSSFILSGMIAYMPACGMHY